MSGIQLCTLCASHRCLPLIFKASCLILTCIDYRFACGFKIVPLAGFLLLTRIMKSQNSLLFTGYHKL